MPVPQNLKVRYNPGEVSRLIQELSEIKGVEDLLNSFDPKTAALAFTTILDHAIDQVGIEFGVYEMQAILLSIISVLQEKVTKSN